MKIICAEERAHEAHVIVTLEGDVIECPGRTFPIRNFNREASMRAHPSNQPAVIPRSIGGGCSVPRMSRLAATIALDRHIRSKHTSQWGKVGDVSQEESRDDMIDWFLNVCQEIGLIEPAPDLSDSAVDRVIDNVIELKRKEME